MANKKSGWAAYNAKQAAARRTARAVKHLSFGTAFLLLLCLLIGVLLGAAGAWYLTRDDEFTLQGTPRVELSVAEAATYSYSEEGYKAVALGKDVSGSVRVSTNLQTNADGTYSFPDAPEGEYYIAYTIDHVALGKVERVRVFAITDGSEVSTDE